MLVVVLVLESKALYCNGCNSVVKVTVKPADEEAAQYRSLKWRVTDRIDVHIIPSSQLFVPSRKYVHSLILQLVMCLTAK